MTLHLYTGDRYDCGLGFNSFRGYFDSLEAAVDEAGYLLTKKWPEDSWAQIGDVELHQVVWEFFVDWDVLEDGKEIWSLFREDGQHYAPAALGSFEAGCLRAWRETHPEQGPKRTTAARRELHIQLHNAKARGDIEEAGRIEAVIVDLDGSGLLAKDVVHLAEKFVTEWMREVRWGL